MYLASVAFAALRTQYPADRRTSPVTSRTNPSSSTSRIVSAFAKIPWSALRLHACVSSRVSAVSTRATPQVSPQVPPYMEASSITRLNRCPLVCRWTAKITYDRPMGLKEMQYLVEERLSRRRTQVPVSSVSGIASGNSGPIQYAMRRSYSSHPLFRAR
jgi:hypothetical protein